MSNAQSNALFSKRMDDWVREVMADGRWRTRYELWQAMPGSRPSSLRKCVQQMAEDGNLETRSIDDPKRGDTEYRLVGDRDGEVVV